MYKIVKCKLSDLLKSIDMSQQQLSEKSHTPKSQISEYINNKHVMSVEKARNISSIIGCHVEDLYEWIWVADD